MWRITLTLLAALLITACSLLTNPKHETLYVNTPIGFPKIPKSSDAPLTKQGIELGRYLFYDPILSKDYDMSCASCHKQAYAFSDGGVTFSVGAKGEPMKRHTPPLFNLAWYSKLFWDGRSSSIESQVFEPVRNHHEMNLNWQEASRRIEQNTFYKKRFSKIFGRKKIDSTMISKVIAQFERTLISSNSKFDRVISGQGFLDSIEYRGFNLMNDQVKGDCLHCHTTDANALGTTGKFSNNGLDNTAKAEDYKDKGLAETTGKTTDIGKFKIPSIRNLSFTAPYMHDGRFSTLEEVLDFYSEGVHHSYNVDSKMQYAYRGGAHLTETEKKQIIAFLRTLDDSSFVKNPQFSNPHLPTSSDSK